MKILCGNSYKTSHIFGISKGANVYRPFFRFLRFTLVYTRVCQILQYTSHVHTQIHVSLKRLQVIGKEIKCLLQIPKTALAVYKKSLECSEWFSSCKYTEFIYVRYHFRIFKLKRMAFELEIWAWNIRATSVYLLKLTEQRTREVSTATAQWDFVITSAILSLHGVANIRESDKFVTSQTVCDNPFVCTLRALAVRSCILSFEVGFHYRREINPPFT